jgi:hypothetical protein
MSDDFELPTDIKALLRSERAFSEIPDSGRANLSRRLGVSVAALGGTSVHSATKLALQGWKGLVAKGVVVIAVGGALAMHATRTESREPDTSVVTPVPQTHETRTAVPLIKQPTQTTVAPASTESPISVSTHVQPSTRQPIALDDGVLLVEEQRLLDKARDAIARGEPEGALDATAQHAVRFVHGKLTEERLAIRIRALARLGRKDEARTLLTEMHGRYPHSFLLEGATRDVETIP